MTRAKCGGTGGIRTLDTLAGTPDFKSETRSASERRARRRRRQKYRNRRPIPQKTSGSARKVTDFSQGDVRVYLLRSHENPDWRGLLNSVSERMTLHPRVSTLDTFKAQAGEAFVVPHRVAFRWLSLSPDRWRKSCVGRLDRGEDGGDVIGDGSDVAALAWLLEGEVRR